MLEIKPNTNANGRDVFVRFKSYFLFSLYKNHIFYIVRLSPKFKLIITNSLTGHVKLESPKPTIFTYLVFLHSIPLKSSRPVPQLIINIKISEYIKEAILSDLTTLASVGDLTDGGAHYPLFMLVLQALYKSEGKEKVTHLFNESKVWKL